jgi:hypothetical protein
MNKEPRRTLETSISDRGGLGKFRSVASEKLTSRDGPFGPPAPQVDSVLNPGEEQVVNPGTGDHDGRREPRAPRKPKVKAPSEASHASEVYCENVTVPLTEELRDRSEDLARLLSRRRSVRKERITRNSIIRVALLRLLETLDIESDDVVNSEEDLLALARRKGRDVSQRP